MTVATAAPVAKRICVVRFGGMGDILLATPAVRALSQHFQTTDIDFIVGRGMGSALTGISYLREITEFDKGGDDARIGNFAAFLSRLRGKKYDIFINFHPSIKTILMAIASGAPKVITFRKDRRKQPGTGRVRHAVDDFTKELKPLGIERVEGRQLDFVIPDAARLSLNDLLRTEFAIQLSEPLLVINPGATHAVNRWSPEKFSELLDRASAEMPHLRGIVAGGPGDVKLAQRIVSGLRNATSTANLAGRLTVKELGALLARAGCVVTADTGPLHIASAVKAPLVTLFGAADPDRTGPLNPRDLVVINRELPCVPCQARTCVRKEKDIACMRDMQVSQVLSAVHQRVREGALV